MSGEDEDTLSIFKKIWRKNKASSSSSSDGKGRLTDAQKEQMLEKLKKEKEDEVARSNNKTESGGDAIDASWDPRSRSRSSRYVPLLHKISDAGNSPSSDNVRSLSPSALVEPLMNQPAPPIPTFQSFKIPKKASVNVTPIGSKSALSNDSDEWDTPSSAVSPNKVSDWAEPAKTFTRRTYDHPAAAKASAFDSLHPKLDISREYAGGYGTGRGRPSSNYPVRQVNPGEPTRLEDWGCGGNATKPLPTLKKPEVETDEWGDPVKPSSTNPPAVTTSADEWGAPAKPKTNTPPSFNSAPKTRPTDDWGVPSVVKSAEVKASGPVGKSAGVKETDEWGDPIKPKTSSGGISSSNPPASSAADDWGEPVAASAIDWGADSWSTPASSSGGGNGGWGGGSSRSSTDGDRGRGRGRGRGGGGRGRGGGGGGDRPPREPREGDWDCECGANNFNWRKECFKCNGAKPAGLGGDSGSNGGGGGRGRGGGRGGGGGRRREGDSSNANYEPINKRSRASSGGSGGGFDDWGSGSSAPSAGNTDDWGSGSGGTKVISKKLDFDDWGCGGSTQPAKAAANDWDTPKTTGTNGSHKRDERNKSKGGDDWGAPAPSKKSDDRSVAPSSSSTSNHRGRQSGSRERDSYVKKDFNPSKDWTDSKVGNVDKKNLKEWTCSDTRCGSTNFDWRDDCFRCGASKANNIVLRESRAHHRETDRLAERQRSLESRESRLLSIFPPISPTFSNPSTPERLKAPPDERNLIRKVSTAGSFNNDRGKIDAFTETPKGWSGQGIEIQGGDESLASIFNVNDRNTLMLPLTSRFEAVVQNPGGGPSTTNTLVGPSKQAEEEIIKTAKEKQSLRRIEQLQETTVEAPKTRARVNNLTWKNMRIVLKTEEDDAAQKIKIDDDKSSGETIEENQMEPDANEITATSIPAVKESASPLPPPEIIKANATGDDKSENCGDLSSITSSENPEDVEDKTEKPDTLEIVQDDDKSQDFAGTAIQVMYDIKKQLDLEKIHDDESTVNEIGENTKEENAEQDMDISDSNKDMEAGEEITPPEINIYTGMPPVNYDEDEKIVLTQLDEDW